MSALEDLAQAILDNRVSLVVTPGGNGGYASSTIDIVVNPPVPKLED